MGAIISECGLYRYRLWREILSLPTSGDTVAFIMLNPSTADATVDDPTIRRCVGYVERWGFARLEVVNLFALRATDPGELRRQMRRGINIIGPDNDRHVQEVLEGAALAVAAWGALRAWMRPQAQAIRKACPDLKVLGLTQSGDPRHPLYLKRDLEPVEWV